MRDGLSDKDQMAEKRLVVGPGRRHARDFLLGDDQDVDRRLGMNIVEGQAAVVFVSNPGRDFAGNDLGGKRCSSIDMMAELIR